jgi:hypothetical protein
MAHDGLLPPYPRERKALPRLGRLSAKRFSWLKAWRQFIESIGTFLNYLTQHRMGATIAAERQPMR